VLISLYAQSTLNRKEITLDLARLMVEKLISTSRREITIEFIQKHSVRLLQDPDPILSRAKQGRGRIVQARQVSNVFFKESDQRPHWQV